MARAKATAQIAVPQSRDEAVQQLESIGSLERNILALEAEQTERINAIKTTTEQATGTLKKRLKALTDGLQTYCEANRKALTNDGKSKSHDFGTGIVEWRTKTARVTVKDAEATLARLLENAAWKKLFVRTKHEIDKEALRSKPTLANTIDGITVGAEGESFTIKPNFEETGDAQ